MLFNKRRSKIEKIAREQRKGAPLFTYTKPEANNSERIRMLRTNLEYVHVGEELTSIAVTSSIPGEGKSTVSANLAVSLGATGKKHTKISSDYSLPSEISSLLILVCFSTLKKAP